MLLKSVLLSEQDIETYGSLFQGEIDTEHVRYSLEETKQDAKALQKTSCRRFKTDNNGFSAEMDVKAETITVFSIPFSDNWTVTINGEKTECVQVDGGMLGIHVPSGHCEIRGDYHTKFAKEAWYIAVVGWMAFSVYLIGVKHRKAMRQI